MKTILILLFFANVYYLNAQTSSDARIIAFDKVEYYSDSIIKCVYKTKKGINHGYAIEFNESGQATSIGKYYKGKKEGKWINNNGGTIYFKKGEWEIGTIPGCGTGTSIQKDNFESLYNELVRSKK
jgi:hypothetical protein